MALEVVETNNSWDPQCAVWKQGFQDSGSRGIRHNPALCPDRPHLSTDPILLISQWSLTC